MSTDYQETVPSRYVVGIDLGTTNSAVCFVDTLRDDWQVEVFSIPQYVAPGQVEARDGLPSFHFQPAVTQAGKDSLKLPWQTRGNRYVVGVMARDEGALTPARMIASAKSWLCHHGVDRTADLLPWHGSDGSGADDVDRLSPIEVSARYLRHIREAWDAQFASFPLAEQDIVLTLPASFDEVARELTIKAAADADLPRVVLIEEPQAAFYAWVDRHRDDWHQRVEPGQKILVCDIGGGTSDFTLIRVRRAGSGQEQDTSEEQTVQFHRIAVGDHLILGGDNLDLALAKSLEAKLGENNQQLQARQWDVLVRSCRQAKESLLSQRPPESLTINLPGSGRKLVGGGLQVGVDRDLAERTLIDGFFPRVALDEQPDRRQSGFQEFGLPYASDSAITRYLASFLASHRYADLTPDDREESNHDSPTIDPSEDPARPDLVLFNGGVFHAPAIRERLTEVISSWFRSDKNPHWSPTVLANDRLDLAVAHGAAYYGMVRRGEGVRIAAGLARSYYLEVGESAANASHPPNHPTSGDPVTTAICVVPGSAQPGDRIELNEVQFDLTISEPVEFPLLVSSTRLTDHPGQRIEVDLDRMRRLPPLRTALRTHRRNQRGTVPVKLYAQLSEIGTIELWCSQVDAERQWRLQFDVRSATETDRQAVASTGESEGVLDESVWHSCLNTLDLAFGETTDESDRLKPNQVVKRLCEQLEMERGEWPMSVLRRIWEALMERQEGRRLSAQHEARWLNLLGYALRPGYGMAVDDWRVTETWRTVQGKLAHGTPNCRNESWVLWRRLSAGLPAPQQRALAEPLLAATRALHHRMVAGKSKGDPHFTIPEFAEVWRLLASLELLSTTTKQQLGKQLIELMPKRKVEPVRGAVLWAIGRLGAREPLYGPLNTVLDAKLASRWCDEVMAANADVKAQAFTLMQLARRTNDRYRDVAPTTTDKVVEWLGQHEVSQHVIELVRDGGQLDEEQQRTAFGESLPKGLAIR